MFWLRRTIQHFFFPLNLPDVHKLHSESHVTTVSADVTYKPVYFASCHVTHTTPMDYFPVTTQHFPLNQCYFVTYVTRGLVTDLGKRANVTGVFYYKFRSCLHKTFAPQFKSHFFL